MYSVSKYEVNNKQFTFIEVTQKKIKISFMDYGATVMSIFVPDTLGKMESVVMAYDNLESYLNKCNSTLRYIWYIKYL